eukprot:scaffold5177_cov31-Tisochrysis_lutea.AAC.3
MHMMPRKPSSRSSRARSDPLTNTPSSSRSMFSSSTATSAGDCLASSRELPSRPSAPRARGEAGDGKTMLYSSLDSVPNFTSRDSIGRTLNLSMRGILSASGRYGGQTRTWSFGP